MQTRNLRYAAAGLATALLLAACGGSDEPAAPAPAPAPAPGEPADETPELSLNRLAFTFEAERSTQLMNIMAAKERTWDNIFDEVVWSVTEDPIPLMISGERWLINGEAITLWPAQEAGLVDFVNVAVFNDVDSWFLITGPGIETPEDLIGKRISAGGIGDAWWTVAEIIFNEDLGIPFSDVEQVTVGGGSDARMQALLAGQIDGFMGQPRHVPPVVDAGGNCLYCEYRDLAQGLLIVEREVMENHRDAVCAALGGLFEAHQWFQTDGPVETSDWRSVQPQVEEYLVANGYDPSEGGLDIDRTWETSQGTEFNWAMDLGAPAKAFDDVQAIMQREDGELSADFDWRNHSDFSCIWDLQEAAGLPLNPQPSEVGVTR
jgi:ABC-type nitrate/sulfonate/bicarbonate transport system substrate-binding protein